MSNIVLWVCCINNFSDPISLWKLRDWLWVYCDSFRRSVIPFWCSVVAFEYIMIVSECSVITSWRSEFAFGCIVIPLCEVWFLWAKCDSFGRSVIPLGEVWFFFGVVLLPLNVSWLPLSVVWLPLGVVNLPLGVLWFL